MYHQSRDPGINQITARPGNVCYGMGLGIMLLDDVYPGFPGDLRNASAWNFPVQYEIAEGVNCKNLVREPDKTPHIEPIVRAAKKLERMGVRGIAAECGYFAWFQRIVAAEVKIPVFMSSLLQVPFAQMLVGPQYQVGMVVAMKNHLTETHLQNVGIVPDTNFLVFGHQDEYNCPQFDQLWQDYARQPLPTCIYNEAEKEFVGICEDIVKKNPGIRALVLECSGAQPFARAVQRAVDMPVLSWGTLLDFAWSMINHRDYYGHV